jgi:hypothetical protein
MQTDVADRKGNDVTAAAAAATWLSEAAEAEMTPQQPG